MSSIKQSVLVTLALLCCFVANADVTFKFAANTIDTGALKTRMEQNVSVLLTEINRAGNSGTNLNLSAVSMEPEAKNRLNSFWETMPFVVDNATVISKCLNDFQGFQVRAIRITMRPRDNSYEGSLNRELTVSLNKNGVITGVRPAWELQEDVTKFLTATGNGGVEEVSRRMELLKWVEDFRCYYNEKNINALEQIYSDDALIITGSVVRRRKIAGDGIVQFDQKVRYTVQDKVTYISNLRTLFKAKKYINVKFDHISVMKHGAKPNIYGVTLHQTWQTNTYQDEGWLFLIWDFTIPEQPQILVRTWQPDQALSSDGVFTLNDFEIY